MTGRVSISSWFVFETFVSPRKAAAEGGPMDLIILFQKRVPLNNGQMNNFLARK